MRIIFYTNNLTLPRSNTINRPIPEVSAPCYLTSTQCREVALSSIKKSAQFNPYYHWVITISSNVEEGDAKQVAEILELPITIYKIESMFLIAGDSKDWINFDYSLSLLLYFLKYTGDISVIFNQDAVMSTLPLPDAGRGNGQRVLVMFAWYLAYIRGFKDFKVDINEHRSRLNGIMSYIQHQLFMKYPELIEEFKSFLRSNKDARVSALNENYVKVKIED